MIYTIIIIGVAFGAGVWLGAAKSAAIKGLFSRSGRKPEGGTETESLPAEASEEQTAGEAEEKAGPKVSEPRHGALKGKNGNLSQGERQLVERAMEYVNNNLKRPELSVEELSTHLGMSRVHLYKRLLATTGRTPIEFIRVMRLRRGMQLLAEGRLNVTEVARRVGFNSPRIFSRYFKEEYGVLPSDNGLRETPARVKEGEMGDF